MRPDVYLDIDGVILANDLNPANYAREFLKLVISRYLTFWLTTHCKGDAKTAVNRLTQVFEPEMIPLLEIVSSIYNRWDA
jgi:ribonucleotide monophosphatase NagD (HAD superfamily)